MALNEFLEQLEQLSLEATAAFHKADSLDALEEIRVEFVGAKKGRLKTVQKQMGQVDGKDKPEAGKQFNATKLAIEESFQDAQQRLSGGDQSRIADPTFDATLPGETIDQGHLHPITQTIEELKDIMGRLGFSVADGPEIEDAWHNFEALNILSLIHISEPTRPY